MLDGTHVGTCGTSGFSSGYPILDGSCKLVVPPIPPGVYTLTAVGSPNGDVATTSFTVLGISISPGFGPPGTTVDVTGYAVPYFPGSPILYTSSISIGFGEKGGSVTPEGSCPVSSTGETSSCLFTIPTVGGGNDQISAQAQNGACPSVGFDCNYSIPLIVTQQTSTSVDCAPSPFLEGSASGMTCTASVTDASPTPVVPTGGVIFGFTNGEIQTSLNVDSNFCALSKTPGSTNEAQCSISFNPTGALPGSYSVTAQYLPPDLSTSLEAPSAGSTSFNILNPALSAPIISATPTSLTAGQSSTLSITTPPSGGTPSYACEWRVESPGSSSFSNFASSDCASSASTGTLTAGTWSFELQVTDAAGVTVTSNAVSVAVATASPTISTTVSNSGTITIGGSATDKATLSGAFTPTGSITYSVFTNSGCTTAVPTGSAAGQYTPNVVSANGANDAQTTSTAFTPASAGTYYWNAVYSGDGNNKAATSSCEALTVTTASPTINTAAAPSSVTLGTSAVTLKDAAILSGGYSPTGTITFTLYYNGGATPVDTETVTVSGDGSYSTPTGYTLSTSGTVTGPYQWDASYLGDGNNNAATDNVATNELVAVVPASPTISTTSGPAFIPLGTASVPLFDVATLAGGYHETGAITFTLYLGPTLVDTETVPVSGDGSYVTPTGYVLPATGTVTGTYQWDATYSGDANNVPSSDSNAANERVTVSPASPTISTTPSPSRVTLSSSTVTLMDTATLPGGYFPTGTITFTLYYGGCSGTLVDTETASVSSNGPYSTPTGYTLPTGSTVTGTYEWAASYGGDTNNNFASTTCGAESATVSNASPSIGTIVSNSGTMTIGGSATDQGTFSNAYGTLTGTLVFSAYTSSSCNGGSSFTSSSIAVSGNGPYTSNSFPPSAPGTYYWQATFTDTDGNNNGFSSACGGSGETLDVQKAQPSVSTVMMPASTNSLGTSTYDTASIGNQVSGFTPSGTVTYDFYASASCSSTPTATSVTLNGDGSVPNSASQILAAGSYRYSASYSGDSNYNASPTGACELLTIMKATATISTTLNAGTNPVLGAAVSDEASATGVTGFAPTGTVTITLYTGGSCTGTAIQTYTGQSLGSSSPNVSPNLASGPYSFEASAYSGDNNYVSGTSGICEPFTVQTPAQSTSSLISLVNSMNIPHGTTTSLVSKLSAALDSINRGNDNAAVNQLNAFINEVNAQTGKAITQSQAQTLTFYAQAIITSLS